MPKSLGSELPELSFPEPESDDLGRYLEDTITVDWQTPSVLEKSKTLVENLTTPQTQLQRLFEFVRDEIHHSLESCMDDSAAASCRASEVLSSGTGLCYAKSHLLAALLRAAGFPAGFCYMRLAKDESPGQFELHGFNGVYWPPTGSWIFLDARGNRPEPEMGDAARLAIDAQCRFEPPWQLAYAPNPERGEAHLPMIYGRPAKRIIDLLERAPNLATVVRNLPDTI